MSIIQERLDALTNGSITGCECGCGEPAPVAQRNNARKGHIKGQPLHFVSGHNKRGTTDLSRYTVLASGCWRWDGARSRKGYGRAQVDGEHTGAHRAVWEQSHGEKLPKGVHLDHLCRNVWCVNPDHLEPVTPAENRRRQASALELLDQMIKPGDIDGDPL